MVFVVVFFADVVTDSDTRHVPVDTARTVDFTTRHTRGVVTRIVTLARRGTVSRAFFSSAARDTDIEISSDALTAVSTGSEVEVNGGIVVGGTVATGVVVGGVVEVEGADVGPIFMRRIFIRSS